MINDIDIDKLFDEADAAHQKQQLLEERIKKPIVRSYSEFLDEDGNVKDKSPFYVVVHKGVIEDDKQQIDAQTRKKILGEIDFIEKNFDHTSAGPFQRAAVPYNRLIIVCGAYDAVCVGQQHDLLIKGGFNTYISKEGTLPNLGYPNSLISTFARPTGRFSNYRENGMSLEKPIGLQKLNTQN